MSSHGAIESNKRDPCALRGDLERAETAVRQRVDLGQGQIFIPSSMGAARLSASSRGYFDPRRRLP